MLTLESLGVLTSEKMPQGFPSLGVTGSVWTAERLVTQVVSALSCLAVRVWWAGVFVPSLVIKQVAM